MRQKRPLMLVFAPALIWILLAMVRPALGAGDGLTGEYFANPDWNGSPAFSAVDTELSGDRMRQRWNGAPPEEFSVRWGGFLTVGRPGLYTFTTTSDDGSQLIVDNELVVDNSGPHGPRAQSGSIRLDRGPHNVVMRYEQFGAASVLEWSWSRDGGDASAVPAWALSQQRASYATVVTVRIVDWGLWIFASLTALATLLYVRAGVSGRKVAVGRWVDARRLDAAGLYRNAASLVFSVLVYIVILFLPWPDSGNQRFFAAVGTTFRDLNTTAIRSLRRFEALQSDIHNRQTDESVLPVAVQEMLTMLRDHGVERYQLSDSIAADNWVKQQIVASGWPRKLEQGANARFVLKAEPVMPGCSLVDQHREVSLVYCP